MYELKAFLLTVLHLIWGAPQNLLGALLFWVMLKKKHYMYRGVVVTEWDKNYSISLGVFIFLSIRIPKGKRNISQRDCMHNTLIHEYGHSVQFFVLGPLYLLIIGIPSMIWAKLPVHMQYGRFKGIAYHKRFYTERWADSWGEKVLSTISSFR